MQKCVDFIDTLRFLPYYQNMKKIIQTLENTGLDSKEAVIYTSLLQNGKMTATEISRNSKVKRATAYQHIEGLLEKDLITRLPIGKRMYYLANNPKKILADFDKKKKDLESNIKEMSKLFNESIHKPKVSFYEGKREIKKVYDDLFQTTSDMYSIFPPASFFQNFSEQEYKEFDLLIKDHAFKSKDLIVDQEGIKKVLNIRKNNGEEGQYTKTLPKSFESNVDVVITGNKVALISLGNLSALVIENDEIADFFKNTHKFFWKHS